MWGRRAFRGPQKIVLYPHLILAPFKSEIDVETISLVRNFSITT
jgi:hypothetical protein